jgi:large subunit ribosomal protein L22
LAAVETRREVRAEAKWVRTSAQKARLVLQHIRGRTVPEARSVLAFSERAVARDIELVLRSAVANAEANHGLIGDELVVVAAYANEGPTLKRFRPRARGRVGPIQKKTCHITVKLVEVADGGTPRRRRPQAEAPAAEEATKPKPKRGAAAKPKAEKTAKPKAEKAEASEEKPKRAPRRTTEKPTEKQAEETTD